MESVLYEQTQLASIDADRIRSQVDAIEKLVRLGFKRSEAVAAVTASNLRLLLDESVSK